MNIRSTVNAIEYDAGLRTYLLSIYNWMILGLLVSAGTAAFAHASGLTESLKQGGFFFWLVALAPFAIIFLMARGLSGASSVGSMAVGFLLLTACEGFTLSMILERYTGGSVISAFLVTAVGFGALSLYGYTTKRNLTGMGVFFLVALFGLIAAMIVEAFTHSPAMHFIVSVAGVLIFAGLIAYDTQTMRAAYVPGDEDSNQRYALWSALDLYLDFINLMLFVLRLMGVSSSSNDD